MKLPIRPGELSLRTAPVDCPCEPLRWTVAADRDLSLTSCSYPDRVSHRTKQEVDDLQQAARFRGGLLVSDDWNGEMHVSLTWKCCQDHTFKMSPHTVLKGGHWCLDCILPPWNYQEFTGKSKFAMQVLNP